MALKYEGVLPLETPKKAGKEVLDALNDGAEDIN